MGLIPKGGWISAKAVMTLLDFVGFGQTKLAKFERKKDGQHHFILRMVNNPVTEHAKNFYGEKSMVCEWFAGVFAAHGEMEFGLKNVKLKENKCICRGDFYCEFEVQL